MPGSPSTIDTLVTTFRLRSNGTVISMKRKGYTGLSIAIAIHHCHFRISSAKTPTDAVVSNTISVSTPKMLYASLWSETKNLVDFGGRKFI